MSTYFLTIVPPSQTPLQIFPAILLRSFQRQKTLVIVPTEWYIYSMGEKEYFLYEGSEFTIEWYYAPNGRSQAHSYFNALSDQQQDRFLSLVRAMGSVGKIFNRQKFTYEGDGIYAFKPQPQRFLCFFFTGKKIIVTNGFHKQTQKLPVEVRARALRAKQDYERRMKEGSYYE